MLLAAFLTTALVVGAASAWQLLRNREQAESRIGLTMAVGLLAVVAPLQLLAGHWSGEVAKAHQPQKLAAIESYWETKAGHPLVLFAIPDRATQSNHYELAVPGAGIIVAPPDEVITGLDAVAPEDQPPVFLVFWAFRIMVGLGLLMIGLGVWGAWQVWRKRLTDNRWFLRFAVAMGPAGFVAVVAGWIVTEVGRQPWVVYGVLRTADAVSPVTTGSVMTSLLIYMTVYAVVFVAGAIYILRLLDKGPAPGEVEPSPDRLRAPGAPLAAAPDEAPGDPK
jgi:cytochrome d ubiquinol oxidase subunit I